MKSKLTLTIKKEVVDKVKKYAQESGQSLSDLVENYLKIISTEKDIVQMSPLSPNVKKLKGIIKTDKKLDYKAILTEELSKKYEF